MGKENSASDLSGIAPVGCSHIHWTINGNEPAGALQQSMVTCIGCGMLYSLRSALVSMQERISDLEKRLHDAGLY